jgi:NAD(P)-dependent dehydrogenase (short-subunit alcohol dehydrogenase family)
MPEDPILKDRVILVTGATGGLGQILSMAFARAGATVVLHGRVVRKLEALFDRIVEAGGPEPAILPLDFEKAGEDAFQSAASAVDSQLGRLDALVHCAATLRRLAPIEYHSIEDWSSVLRVNLSAPAALTRALLPALRRSSAGTVIFTLDSRGHEPAAYWGSYAAAKAGVEALVKVLHDEWEASPLSACGIVPGPIDTPLRQRTHPGDEPGIRQPATALVPLYMDILQRGKSASGQILIASGKACARD